MMTTLREGYKQGRSGRKKGLENFGKRDMRAVRKNTSRGEGNPIQISRRGLGYSVALLIELRSRRFGVKVTLELQK